MLLIGFKIGLKWPGGPDKVQMTPGTQKKAKPNSKNHLRKLAGIKINLILVQASWLWVSLQTTYKIKAKTIILTIGCRADPSMDLSSSDDLF